jgi:hypothetical protein
MAKAYLSISPYFVILDDNGVPCSGGKVWTYAAGTNNLKDTYTDYDSGVVQTNPIVADSGGRVEIWAASDGLYKLVITDSDDVIIRTVDDVGIGGTGTNLIVNTVIGASDSLKALADSAATSVVALGYRTIGDGFGGTFRWSNGSTGNDDGETVDGNTPYTTGRWKRIIIGDCIAGWWGTYGNNSDNDKAYIDLALTYAKSVSKALVLTNGTYLLSSSVDFQQVPVIFEDNASFSWTNFAPDMTAIVQPGDLTQHFKVGTSTTYTPKFAQGTISSPYWFGGKADSSTADDAAINQAIKAVSYYGGSVNLSDGTWAIDTPIVPLTNTIIQGAGLIKRATGFSGACMVGSLTVAAHNAKIKDIQVTGDPTKSTAGIVLAGNETEISGCIVKDCGIEGIRQGSLTAAADSTNVLVKDNTVTNCGALGDNCLLVTQGKNIVIQGNTVAANASATAAIATMPYQNGIENVQILDNIVSSAPIKINLDTVCKTTDVNVSRNHVDNKILVTGSTYLYGQVQISDNNVSTDSTGIAVVLTGTDVADNYSIKDNVINGSTKGIILTSVTKPLFVNGNVINGAADSTGIIESGVTDASYGTNLFNSSVADWYVTAESRYCTLGTNLRSQIDGDATSDNGLIVTGRLQETFGVDATVIANTITPPAKGNAYHIPGHDQTCNLISSSGWLPGSVINLVFDSSNTVNHNSTISGINYPILLSKSNTITTKANDVMALLLDSSSRWLEVGYTSSGTVPQESTVVALFGNVGSNGQFFSAADRTSTVYYKYEEAAVSGQPAQVTLAINKKYGIYPGSNKAPEMISTNAPLPAIIRPAVALTIPIQVYTNAESHPGVIRILTDGNFDFAMTQASSVPVSGGSEFVFNQWAYATTYEHGWDAFLIKYPLWP